MAGSRKYFRARELLLWGSILVPAALLLMTQFLFHRPAPEPTWKGRPVSAWVKEIRFYGPEDEVVAEEAVLHLGPRALPCLIANLQKRDTMFSDFWFKTYPELPSWVRKKVAAPRARCEARE